MSSNDGMRWVIGANMVGYLPEGEPYVLDDDATKDDALRALGDEVMREWESHEMACDDAGDCDTCGEYLTAHTDVHNGSTDVYVGYVHYWATQVPESDAVQYLDAEEA